MRRAQGNGPRGEKGHEGAKAGDANRPLRLYAPAMETTRKIIRSHTELEVYRRAFRAAMRIFELTRGFPSDEKFSLTPQIRRSSRSVCANIAEGWRKRRYQAAFVSKLTDSEGEAAETQTWIEFAVGCGCVPRDIGRCLYDDYDAVLGMLVKIIAAAKTWCLR